jgi:hypothetical protein
MTKIAQPQNSTFANIGTKHITFEVLKSFVALYVICSASSAAVASAAVSATKTGDKIVVESTGGPITYKAIVDSKSGGDITDLRLPAHGNIVASNIGDVFYYGTHGEDYTLRGWTGRDKFTLSCSQSIASQKSDEVTVEVKLVVTGTFKVLTEDANLKAKLKKTLVGYKDKTVELKRTYTFKPDRVIVNDELLWVYPDMQIKRLDFSSRFAPATIQAPARLVSGTTKASFYEVGSGGEKVPKGIAYPLTAENYLKNGYVVTVRNIAASFDLGKSEKYFYEKRWQQDWDQVSGYILNLAGYPTGKAVTMTHEITFAKAAASDMPPVVTIQSPPWDARWLDEKGEVAKYKIGETVRLAASAVNSDGSPVPDKDISWQVHIDPYWETPPVTLNGASHSYKLPDSTNAAEKEKAKDRNLLGVMIVKVKGKNGTEATEIMTTLVGRAE